MPDLPERPPEARLLLRKRKARRLTVAQAARLAGVSVSLYRQVENGYHVPAKGLYLRKTAPADTLARIMRALGAAPEELRQAGRPDAAGELEDLLAGEAPPPDRPAPLPDWAPEAPAEYEARVWGMVRAAERKHRRSRWDLAGPDIFPDSASMAAIWDSGEFDEDLSVRLIARILQEIGGHGEQAGGEHTALAPPAA